MLHIVSFSTGLSSALAAVRVLERYGRENVEIVFLDTGMEDDDNYRFMRDFESRFGVAITVLRDGRTPYEVFEEHRIVPNHRIAPCTFVLKIRLFMEYLRSKNGRITIHIGYDFSEAHRCEPTRRAYESMGYTVDFPLLWKPIEYRPYHRVAREDWGIAPPRMYRMGYTHANCGGLCIKQGQGDWVRTLIHFPGRFAWAEKWEQTMRGQVGNHAILRDRTGGESRPLTLRELRERYEEKPPDLFTLDTQAACVVCGIGAVDTLEAS